MAIEYNHKENTLTFFERTTDAATPDTGKGSVFIKSDGKLYFINESGTVSDITAAGAFTLDSDENIFAGTGAGAALTTAEANDNFLVGNNAGNALTTGDNNIAIGIDAAKLVTTGSGNIVLGAYAGDAMSTSASNNILVGQNSGGAITFGGNNIIVGVQAGLNFTTGSYNLLMGSDAGKTLSVGAAQNIILGALAADDATGAQTQRVILGYSTFGAAVTSLPYVGIGATIGASRTDFSGSTIIGRLVGGGPALTGSMQQCIYIGDESAYYSGSSTYTIGIGYRALQGSATEVPAPSNGVFIGSFAGRYVGTNTNNTAVGYQAFQGNGTANVTGQGCVAVGYAAMLNANFTDYDVCIGYRAGYGLGTTRTGDNNVFIGANAGLVAAAASGNTVVGHNAGDAINSGTNNAILGTAAGGAVTSGDFNTLLGDGAGAQITTQNNNVCIGKAAGPTSGNAASDELYIHNAESLTPLIYGNFASGSELVTINGDFEVTKHIYFDAEVANTTAVAIDWTDGNKQSIAPTAATSPTYTFTAPSGPTNLTMKATNLGAVTAVTWPATVKWPAGTEPTWTSSGTDIINFYYDGTNYHGSASLDSK